MERKSKKQFEVMVERVIDEFVGFLEFVLVFVAFILMFAVCLVVALIRNIMFVSGKFWYWLRTPLNY